MDKVGETLASSSLSLPLATLWLLTQLKVKVLCWIACLLPLSLGPLPPAHALPHYWPGPLPPAPHIPWHPPSCPHPLPSQTGPRRLSHAVGAYVFHLDSPPHLCACGSPGPYPSDRSRMSCCPIITRSLFFFFLLINHRITFLENWQTALQHCIVRTCKSFHVWQLSVVRALHRGGHVIVMSYIVGSCHHPILMCCSVPSGHVKCCYFGLDVRREVNSKWKEGSTKLFLHVRGIALLCPFVENKPGHKAAFQSPISVEGKRETREQSLTSLQEIYYKTPWGTFNSKPSHLFCLLMTAINFQSLCSTSFAYWGGKKCN